MENRIEQSILIVDDSPTDLQYLERVLRDERRRLVTASSGEEALAHLLEHDFALVLLDVQLPDIDGYEVAERIRSRQNTRRIPIIFITATSLEASHIFKGYDSGAVDYLFKPVEPHLLRGKADVFCQLHAQHATIEAQLKEISAKNEALNKQIEEIKVLRGLVPICALCKNVRDDSGHWATIESYIKEHSEAEFSHSICPECTKKLYPEIDPS